MARYTFQYWADATNLTAPLSTSNPWTGFTITADITIVAVYAIGTHLVTFNSSGTPAPVTYTQPAGQGGGSQMIVNDGATVTLQVPNEVTQ